MSAPENEYVLALRMVSAGNLRLATIVEAADKLAKAIEAYREHSTDRNADAVKAALDAFKVVRQGQ